MNTINDIQRNVIFTELTPEEVLSISGGNGIKPLTPGKTIPVGPYKTRPLDPGPSDDELLGGRTPRVPNVPN